MMKGRAEFQTLTGVSRETLERLDIYLDLLAKWTKRINLVSPRTLPEAWSRHFLDSAQLLKLAPAGIKSWVDLGSGGGFPGAVVAVMAAESQPNLRVALIESDQRKAAFLRSVSRETAVAFDVLCQRIETAPAQEADIVSARALAPLIDLLGYASRHLAPDGVALLQKGSHWQEEVKTALEAWQFRWEKNNSATDNDAVILKVEEVIRV